MRKVTAGGETLYIDKSNEVVNGKVVTYIRAGGGRLCRAEDGETVFRPVSNPGTNPGAGPYIPDDRPGPTPGASDFGLDLSPNTELGAGDFPSESDWKDYQAEMSEE